MEKAFVAQRVAAKLIATEESVDTALVEAAELMAEMIKARRDLNISTVFGNEAAAKLNDAMKALGEARTAMVAVHEELNEAKLRIGVRTRLGIEKPIPVPTGFAEVREVG